MPISAKKNKAINKTSEPKIIIVVNIWAKNNYMNLVDNVKVYQPQTQDYLIH